MEKLIDMHTHTCFSDGDLTPNELVLYAKEHNIGTLSITDHDTVDGVKNLDRRLIDDIVFYPGIELTAKVNKGRMHILGYNIDIENKELLEKLEEIDSNVLYSMMSYFSYLKIKHGISFSVNDIKDILNAKRNIGRPDIAKLMIKYGYVNSIDEAFDEYLTEMYNKLRSNNKGISPKECIDLIKQSGGISVLAHPHSLLLSDDELLSTVKELKEYGLEGLEVYHSNHSYKEMKKYRQLAEEQELLISGGSDYHGNSVKPNIEIGTGKNDNISIHELSLVKKYKSMY